jgi:hypothetical protein
MSKNIEGDEIWGLERAKDTADDWWEMFDFPNNPMFKEAVTKMLSKYPSDVVRQVVRSITLELKPKYLPNLGKIKNALDSTMVNRKKEFKTQDMLDKFANTEEGGTDQQLYFRGIRGLLKMLGSGQINKAEYLERQAKWFDAKGMEEDAKYMYEMRDRELQGLNTIHPEDWKEVI